MLTGILVSLEDGTLRMVATDSYRLSVKETPSRARTHSAFEANVPARALQELGRVVAETQPESVSIVTRDNQVVFGSDRVTLSSRLIDGQFPNYRQLLPESYEHDVVIDKSELLGVVRRVSLMAQRNAPLRLRFEEGTVTLSAQTPDVGEASESVPVNYQGDELEIGFNPQFLQDGLESVGADEVRMRLISPLRPGLIEAGGRGRGGPVPLPDHARAPQRLTPVPCTSRASRSATSAVTRGLELDLHAASRCSKGPSARVRRTSSRPCTSVAPAGPSGRRTSAS